MYIHLLLSMRLKMMVFTIRKKIKMTRIIYMYILFVLIGCGKTSLNAELGTPFKMTSVQTVKVNETDIKLNGYKILEDSRCPKDVNCIWEGQVVAEFQVNGLPFKINTQKMTDTLGYSFKINSVEPIKEQGVEIPVTSYIIDILISKTQLNEF